MGYSGRYHAASLAAVFLALAIGILIGVGLADDIVSGASEELEQSLRSDLDEAETRVADLDRELERERQFGDSAYPALVDNRLQGSEIAIVGFGDLPEETGVAIEEALGPAGARIAAVGVVELPPDRAELGEAAGRRFGPVNRSDRALERYGRALGGQIAGGGGQIDRVRSALFSNFSGELGGVDRIVVVRAPPGELDEEEEAASSTLESGMLAGMQSTAAALAGVERTDADPSTLGPLSDAGIPTVDHVDLVAGRVALVFALLGAGGDYGVKEGADSFLPELLQPPPGQ